MKTFALVLVLVPVVVALYGYFGYPMVLWMMARAKKSPVMRNDSFAPRVSVVIPAYNEEHQIGAAIDAVLAQNYPLDRMQILIMSDASTDGTDSIVESYAARGVELLRMPERSGKTKMENTAAPLLRGDIIVNTDASIRLHEAAVRELVAAMTDPTVGVATGRDLSISAMGESVNATEKGYVNYEMWVRSLETATGGIVGASGSCYAILAELHRIPIRSDLSRDFSAALTARRHNLKAVSVDSALCFVPRTASLGREYRRKVRTIARGMNTLYDNRELLDPARYGGFALKLASHKICRWLVPIAAIPALAGLVLLAGSAQWARVLLAMAGIVVVLAIVGALWPTGRTPPRIVSLAAFTLAANLAVVHAFWKLLSGHQNQIWEPTRRAGRPAQNDARASTTR
ncbi:MAG TPA: glycosyltransferase [Gemmatimonadaceae bacterium]|nr:glycosyltransferase [Gemmatimonadaceae bacterium]